METRKPETIDELFEQYRRSGDSESLSAVYDLAYDELLATARKLARDADTAEELVGRTFLTAIERAERWDSQKRLVPWLVGILIVESKRMRRKDARAIDPERVESHAEPQSEDAASQSEIAATLRGALAKLPEAQRDLLQRHYFEDETPTTIAEALGREAGTVRVQLHRARTLLRQALPAGFALGTALAVLAPHGRAAVRERVLAEAEARAAELAGHVAASGASVAGTIALWKLAAAGVCALTLSGVAWWALDRRGESVEQPGALARSSPIESVRDDSRSNALAEAPLGSPRAALRAGAASVGATLRDPSALGVHIVAELTGLSVQAGETMDVQARPGDPRIEPRWTTIAAAPHFELDITEWYAPGGPEPREIFVVVDHARYLSAQQSVWLAPDRIEAARSAAGSRTQRVELPVTLSLVPAAAFVSGRVQIPAQRPGSSADVPNVSESLAYAGLFERGPDGKPAMDPVEARPCNADGSFHLRARKSGPHVLVLVHALARPRTDALDLAASESRELGAVSLEAGTSIDGTVRGPGGQSAPAAQVHAILAGATRAISMYGQPLAWRDGRFEHPGRTTIADDRGLFFLGGLAPGAYELTVGAGRDPNTGAMLQLDDDGFGQSRPHSTESSGTITVTAPASGIALATKARSVILHVTAQGQSVAKCSVERIFPDGGSAGTSTDENGRIVLVWSRPAALDLRLDQVGFVERTVHLDLTTLEPGSVIEVALERGEAPCDLSFDAGGRDLSWAKIQLTPIGELSASDLELARTGAQPSPTPGSVYDTLDSSGKMHRPVRAGRYWLYLSENSTNMPSSFDSLPTWFELEVPAAVALRQPLELRTGGRLRFPAPRYHGRAHDLTCQLTDARGIALTMRLTSVVLRSDTRQGRISSTNLQLDSASETQVLEAGEYTLRVEAADARAFEAKVVVEPGRTVEVQVALEPK